MNQKSEKTVLCGASAYTEKYYLNDEFQALPDAIKDVKYYTFGDNKNEQAARAYWAKIKGEENV